MSDKMAKDDYFVIVYRVLVYFYACLKREILFDDTTFNASVKKDILNEEYFVAVLRMMQDDGLITGLVFTKPWGQDYILVSDVKEAEITSTGIKYLKDNSNMRQVAMVLKEMADIIASLASTIL